MEGEPTQVVGGWRSQPRFFAVRGTNALDQFNGW